MRRLPLVARRPPLDAASAAYVEAPLPRGRTPWRQASFCALDFELTGLDPSADEIIAFGAVPIEAGRVRLRAAVSRLVRPVREIGEASIRVHGIRAADLVQAPRLEDCVGMLLEAIAGRVLVVHTAAIERPFLSAALRKNGVRFRGPVVDTEVLGRLWLHERDGEFKRRLALGKLAAALGLPADRPHDALGDAVTTAQVFIALATHLDAIRPETVGSLARARRRLDAVRMFHR